MNNKEELKQRCSELFLERTGFLVLCLLMLFSGNWD